MWLVVHVGEHRYHCVTVESSAEHHWCREEHISEPTDMVPFGKSASIFSFHSDCTGQSTTIENFYISSFFHYPVKYLNRQKKLFVII